MTLVQQIEALEAMPLLGSTREDALEAVHRLTQQIDPEQWLRFGEAKVTPMTVLAQLAVPHSRAALRLGVVCRDGNYNGRHGRTLNIPPQKKKGH